MCGWAPGRCGFSVNGVVSTRAPRRDKSPRRPRAVHGAVARASSARTSSAASATRARFSGRFSHPLAPDGWGSGIARIAVRGRTCAPTASVTDVTPEQPPRREPADGDDETRAQQPKLPLAPERAQPLLVRRRRPVAAAGSRAAGIAPRDRRAVERGVELVLLHASHRRSVLPARPRHGRRSSPSGSPAPARTGTRAAPFGRGAITGSDSSGYPASTHARQTAWSRCSDASDRYAGSPVRHSRGASSVVHAREAARRSRAGPPARERRSGRRRRGVTSRAAADRARRTTRPTGRPAGGRPAIGGTTRSATSAAVERLSRRAVSTSRERVRVEHGETELDRVQVVRPNHLQRDSRPIYERRVHPPRPDRRRAGGRGSARRVPSGPQSLPPSNVSVSGGAHLATCSCAPQPAATAQIARTTAGLTRA